MKTALLLLLAASLLLPACSTTQSLDSAELAKLANTALTVAEIGGVVNSKQAATARQAGKLVLDFQSTPDDQKLALASNIAVDYAVAQGKITPEQAHALRSAGTVPLTPPTGPSNALLPPP